MLGHQAEFAFGMRQWLNGDDTLEAEAAGNIIGETFLMWRKVLESKFRK